MSKTGDSVSRGGSKTADHSQTRTFQTRTDKQNALGRECTFKFEIILEIGVAGINIY